MAKKTQPYSPFGNMGEKIKDFFTPSDKAAEQPGIVRAARGVGNAIMTGGASIANDVDAEKDKPFGKALRRAGEVASTAVLTGGASIAPQVIGGDSYRPQQGPPAPPAVKAKPKTSKPSRPSTSAPAAVRTTTTAAAPSSSGRDARFDALYAEEKRRMGPSGRGGGGNEARDRAARRLAKEEGRVNSTAYKRGESVSTAKKRNSIHNTSALKWFRGGDD